MDKYVKLQSQSDDEDIVAFLLDHLGYAFVNLRPILSPFTLAGNQATPKGGKNESDCKNIRFNFTVYRY